MAYSTVSKITIRTQELVPPGWRATRRAVRQLIATMKTLLDAMTVLLGGRTGRR